MWAGVSSSLASAVQALGQANAPPTQGVAKSIPGYTGPTIPRLWSNVEVAAQSQQVLNSLFSQIPALAPQGSAVPSSGAVLQQQYAPHPLQHPAPLYAQQPPSAVVAPQQQPVYYPQQQPGAQPAHVLHQSQMLPGNLQHGGMQVAGHVSSLQQPQLLPGVGGHLQPLLGAPIPLQSQDLQQESSQRLSQLPHAQDGGSKPINLDDLLSATIKHKQYYPIEFAKLSKFPCVSNLNDSNINLSLFAYGSVRHLLLLSDGTLPAVSREEFNARLQHLLHVLEITCLESSLQEFSSHSFKVAKEYSYKILSDIERGYKA